MKSNVFRKGLVIGVIVLFVGASFTISISVNVEEKNKTNIDIGPILNENIIKESSKNDNIDNEKNERYKDTQPAIFDGGNSKAWSITEVVSTESTEHSYRPSLMVDNGGIVHVTWQDRTNYGGSDQDWDIFYKYKTSGGSWSTTEVVSTESINESWRPSLMVDNGGVIHIAWMDYTDYGGSGSDSDIFYKYKNSDGSWSTTEVVSTESTEDSYRPSLMVDNDGVIHIAWFDLTDYGGSGSDFDIFYKYKNSDGSWSTTEVVSTESSLISEFPSLMVDINSVVHIAWRDRTDYGGSGSDSDIFYKYKNSDGSWSTTEVVSTESWLLSEFPSLMVESGGVVHVAWKDNSNYSGSGWDSDIFYKYRISSGSWSNTEVVSTESTDYSYYPSLYVDSSGFVHIAWYDYTDYIGSGTDEDIFYKFKNIGNQIPNEPDISGPTSGKAGVSYDYIFTSTDPDGDKVSYFIKWDDGSITDWTAFQASGPPGYSEAHKWDIQDIYTIEGKARDIYGAESNWAKLVVTMPRNRATYNSLLLRFLEQFPILKLLLLQR